MLHFLVQSYSIHCNWSYVALTNTDTNTNNNTNSSDAGHQHSTAFAQQFIRYL